MAGFTTDSVPKYFSGEDVIGDTLYEKDRKQSVNSIPSQLQAKLSQFPSQQPSDYDEEEINISQPLTVNYPSTQQHNGETITKNIKINLEINLKINVI